MFNIFKNKKQKVEQEEQSNVIEDDTKIENFFDDENSTKNIDLFLSKFFECDKFYTYVFVKPPKAEKYYTQVVNSQLLGYIYTDKIKAQEHLNDELKSFKNDGLTIKEMNMEEILSYIEKLQINKIDGLIINYPFNWIIFNLKN